ncbi:MAG: VWA domain-containing protein [Ilumatobacteraceae bacterium]
MPSPDLAAISARFAAHLHAVGVEVGPDRAGRFASTVQLARPGTTDELYWLGRVTLTGSPTDIAIYDRVFADVFLGIADVSDSRGDPNQPSVDSFDRRSPRPVPDAAAPPRSSGAPRTSPEQRDSGEMADDENVTERPTGAPASSQELLRRRNFAACTQHELAQLRRLVSELEVAAPQRSSRRRRRHRSGTSVDHRATLRRARRTGGHPAHLIRRRTTARRRSVVLIADVSGSMETYSRAYLYLLHGAVEALRAETFVFATRLTRLTRTLRTSDPEHALRTAVDGVDDWSGGTRIGEAIREFNDRWGRRGLARGAVIVIVSDGWESDDPALLGEQMARLSRLAHRIIWVNPRAQSDRYQPLAAGMAAALPHVDTFTSGHSLDALDEVLAAIARD